MELKEGMYLRTKCGIAKIETITDEYLHCDNTIMRSFGENYYSWFRDELKILKASDKIIELIEEGDYVNGMKVNNIAKEDGLIFLHMDADECLHEDTMLTGDDIKTVVTKEQFESMSYKVGE